MENSWYYQENNLLLSMCVWGQLSRHVHHYCDEYFRFAVSSSKKGRGYLFFNPWSTNRHDSVWLVLWKLPSIIKHRGWFFPLWFLLCPCLWCIIRKNSVINTFSLNHLWPGTSVSAYWQECVSKFILHKPKDSLKHKTLKKWKFLAPDTFLVAHTHLFIGRKVEVEW